MEAHNLVADERRFRNTTVTLARVRLEGGRVTYYAASNQPYFSSTQQQYLREMGVENILSGEKYRKGLQLGRIARQRHAERIIKHNLPKGAAVEDWGISHAGHQKPFPCATCAPEVEAAGGGIQVGH